MLGRRVAQRWLRGVAVSCLLAAGYTHALGLGDISLHSALNQPLHAEVALQLAGHERLEDVTASLADSEAYKRSALVRPDFLSQLSFRAERNAAGQAVIRISSRDVVREPVLELLLDVRWHDGQMQRQYPLLFDLPTPAVVSPAPPAAMLAKVAQATTKHVIPPAAPVEGYGPVKRGEILGEIARRLKPSGVSTEQMSVALYRANPHAFLDDNINRLRWGTTLFMPSAAQMQAMSRGEAGRFIQAQYDEWKGRSSAVAAVPEAAEGQVAAVAAQPAAGAVTEPAAQLQILAPSPSPADAMVDELQQRLNEVQRINQAVQAENEALRAKLAELEEQTRQVAAQVLAVAPAVADATEREQPTVSQVVVSRGPELTGDVAPGLQLEGMRATTLAWWRDPFWLMVGVVLLIGMVAVLVGRFIWRRYRDVQYRGFNQALLAEEAAKERARLARVEQMRRRFG